MSSNLFRKRRILVVDDHPIVRAGLKAMLADEEIYEVCGEAASESEAMEMIRTLHPDLAIVDLSLSDTQSMGLLSAMLHDLPELKILVLSMHNENTYAFKAIQAGAQGYIQKQEATRTLLEGLNAIFAGQRYVSDSVKQQLLAGIHGSASGASDAASLTRTEQTILELLGKGLSTREISETLGRSIKTIEVHKINIRRKIGIESGSALLRYALGLKQPAQK